jgi:hypothetical protein
MKNLIGLSTVPFPDRDARTLLREVKADQCVLLLPFPDLFFLV